MPSVEKIRLDILMAERNLAPSRESARRMIMAGEVRVNGEMRDKPGIRVAADVTLEVRQAPRFVSRGGEKLAAALAAFPVVVQGRICADVGASTGGFTDCLLQNDAARVYALDVGYGQFDYRLRSDPRVVVIERTNARYVEALAEPVSLLVADVSFISLRYLLPVFRGWLSPGSVDLLLLVKPQFEAGKADVKDGGVVRDPAVHRRVLREVLDSAQQQGYTVRGLIPSPLRGPAGNIEFLTWFTIDSAAPDLSLDDLITGAVAAVTPELAIPSADEAGE
ncbi:MAG: TlyA family RNA methyltransferase [Chloroflexi bacterium]|nr:TlyA family RNA methyltransferase [Chloroflexota bacterium]